MRPNRHELVSAAENRRLLGIPAFDEGEIPTVGEILDVYPLEVGGVHLLAERLRFDSVRYEDLLLCVAELGKVSGPDGVTLRQAIAVSSLQLKSLRSNKIITSLSGKKVRVADIRGAKVSSRNLIFDKYELPVPPIRISHADRPMEYSRVIYPVARAEVLRLPDAHVWTGSDVMSSRGRYFLDNNAWTGAASQNLINDSVLLAVKSNRAIVHEPTTPPESLDKAIWLGFPILEAWGHWVNEGMLRLELFSRDHDFTDLDVLVPDSVPQKFLDLAKVIFPRARFRRIRAKSHFLIKECVYVPLRAYTAHNIFWSRDDENLRLNGEPQLFGAFKKRVLRETGEHLSGAATPGERIYLDRSLAKYRVSRNAARMRDIAKRNDFRIVDPGSLNPLEQLRLFSSAKSLWGQTGSGFFLAPLAPEGCSVLMVGSDFSHDWAGLALAIEKATRERPQFILGERDFVAPGFSERLYHQDFNLSEEAWKKIEDWCTQH